MQPQPSNMAAGWYPDPNGFPTQRWWNGTGWTDQIAPFSSVPPFAARPSTNVMGVASLVCGVLWIWGLGSVLAIIFGEVAWHQIKNSGGLQTGGGMASVGRVLGVLGVLLSLTIILLGKP